MNATGAPQYRVLMTIPQIDSADAAAIREFFRASGFNEVSITERLGAGELNVRIPEERLTHFYNTAEPTPLNWLIRWFMVGTEISRADAEKALPPDILARLLRTGFLVENEGVLSAPLRVSPFADFLVASDHVGKLPEELAGELVTGVSIVARRLLRFTAREPVGRVLDFGTGCGIQALFAAKHAERVIGTDLNPRAIEYSRLNSVLNGVENTEFRQGNGLDPVAGERFDQIVANPPFFITPVSSLMLRENPMELDNFCRTLLRDGAALLSEGGTMQMVFEWVEIKGESWQQRMNQWVAGTSCDAWVLKLYTNTPAEYAERRAIECTWEKPEERQPFFDNWLRFHGERGVTNINGGLVAIRKRAANNWLRCETAPFSSQDNLGEHIPDTFATEEFLQVTDDAALLQSMPRMSPAVNMESVHTLQQRAWTPKTIRLTPPHDAGEPVEVDPPMSLFLAKFDGQTTVRGAAAELAAELGASPEAVENEAAGLARRFLRAGVLLPPGL